MPSANWEHIQDLFLAAADLPREEQSAFLDANCGDDRALRSEVESLLACDPKTEEVIVAAVEGTAQSLFGIETTVGARFGPYRVIREIGRGGMGAVYLAARDDDQYRKQVAIKLVKHGMDTAEVLDRFRHERQILANLDHPYIARIIDGGTAPDGRPFFIMEHVEGQPIDAYASDRGLDIDARCALFLKVCEAVSYAHRNLVVHRDLKPSNILVAGDGTPKLLDFGVAKLLTPDANQTVTGVALRPLTPEYASPEQVLGLAVNTATDVYSLGLVLRELLSGSKARQIQSSTQSEIERAVVEREVTRPSSAMRSDWSPSWRRQLTGDLDNIVMMAVRKEPERRYHSVDQFAEDIRRHLEGRIVVARKDSLRYRAGKYVRRHRIALATAAIVFGSLISGIVIARSGQRRAEQRLSQMVELANRSLFDVHAAIERLPGAMGARRAIVGSTLEYLERLSADAGNDDRLRLAVANAYFRLGDIQGYQFKPNLGDTAGALASYRKAAALIAPLRAKQPENAGILMQWIDVQRRIGFVLEQSGDAKDSLATYRAALPAAELLARLRPTDAEARQREGLLYDGITDVLAVIDPPAALESARKELAILSPLAAAHADNAELLNALSDTHDQIAKILNRRGDLAGCIEEVRKCVAIREQIVKGHPTDVVFKRNLMISYGNLAGSLGNPFLLNAGDPDGAHEYYSKAIGLGQEIAKADPQDRNAQYDLASAMLRYAVLDVPSGGRAESLARLRQAGEIMAGLAAADPKVIRYKRELGIALEYAGHRLRDMGKPEEALVEYRRSLAVAESALALNPDDNPCLAQALVDEEAIANVLASRGDHDGAVGYARKAIARAEQHLASGRDRERRTAFMAKAWLECALVYRKLGSASDVRESRSAAQRALEIWRQLIAGRENHPYGREVARAEALLK